ICVAHMIEHFARFDPSRESHFLVEARFMGHVYEVLDVTITGDCAVPVLGRLTKASECRNQDVHTFVFGQQA
ncbi:hypothetical protein QIG34_28355, partial [Klebsiella pneumoniae]|nr:hypothetical protein [Klebsiella pneumoniae]